MNDFIEKAIAVIKNHARNVSEAAKFDDFKEIYLMGADHACDVLKSIAGNDVVKVVRCKDCKWYYTGFHEKFCGFHEKFCMRIGGLKYGHERYVHETKRRLAMIGNHKIKNNRYS